LYAWRETQGRLGEFVREGVEVGPTRCFGDEIAGSCDGMDEVL
jgi:hypothetical protein